MCQLEAKFFAVLQLKDLLQARIKRNLKEYFNNSSELKMYHQQVQPSLPFARMMLGAVLACVALRIIRFFSLLS